jgi:hypothetical protein
MNLFKGFTLPAGRYLMLLLVFFGGCFGSGGGGGVVAVITPPTVTSVMPASAATGVALNSIVIANFSKALDPSTVTAAAFTLAQGTTPVTGIVKSLGKVVAFYPAANLTTGLVYTATVTTGVKDLLGNALASNYSWSFTTSSATDLVAPTVSSVTPLIAATGVAPNTSINAIFSKPMDPITITSSTFTLAGASPVSGTVSYAGTTATLHPTSNLAANVLYTATITTGAKDMQSNPIASYSWSFTTGSALAAGPAPVNLGTAGSFVILTKTGVTNVHSSAITGNIGSSPITAAAMDNVFCTEITGSIYGVDAAYTGSGTTTCFKGLAADKTFVDNAVLDMMTAYTDAAGRTLPDATELGAGNISGMTLAPGLYKWGTGVLITNAGVTLSGSANDVWIFQISGDLTVANSAIMSLTGGALAKNVFWQVDGPTGVAIGTYAQFEGVIMASKGITVNTGSSGTGRLLAQSAVTLKVNTVTQPAP